MSGSAAQNQNTKTTRVVHTIKIGRGQNKEDKHMIGRQNLLNDKTKEGPKRDNLLSSSPATKLDG